MKFPDFSSISVIFPWFFFQGSKMQIIFIYDFKWGYNFKLKLRGDNWNVIKCYVCPQYSLIMNMFFIMWNSSSIKICLETTDFPYKTFFLIFWSNFPWLFPNSHKIPWLLGKILKFPDWKNFSHFSRFSSASGNPVIMPPKLQSQMQ